METERSSKYRQPKGSFNKRENLVPQFNLEDIDNLKIWKDHFSYGTDPLISMSIALYLAKWSDETSWVFPPLKSISHLLPQSLARFIHKTQVQTPPNTN